MRQIDAQIISLLLLARLLVLRPESGLRWQTILLEALINTLQRAKVISKSALFHYLMRQVRLRNSQEISALRWQISLMFFQEMMLRQSLQISSRYLQMDFLELQIWQLNSKEILYHFTVPVIQNTDKISETLENMLGRWRVTFDALSQSFTDTFDKINSVYDQYFKPFVDSITQGISDILGTFLDAYNTYLSPYLDYISDKFSSVWKEHVQPALDGILELLGKVFENLKALWETALVPCIEWIVNNVMPVLGPIIEALESLF